MSSFSIGKSIKDLTPIRDLIGEKEWMVENDKLSITLQPYDVMWLNPIILNRN